MNNTVNIDSVMQDKLEEKILELAKKVQDGTIEDFKVYTLIENFMGNRLFTRELFVKTLEWYNDNPNITLKTDDPGIETTTCFNLIDAYDFIVTFKKRQAITQSLVAEAIS